ncbi:MAG: hypothetical protein ABIH82_02410 [Candidatus Woesearchaeota archaeon]
MGLKANVIGGLCGLGLLATAGIYTLRCQNNGDELNNQLKGKLSDYIGLNEEAVTSALGPLNTPDQLIKDLYKQK